MSTINPTRRAGRGRLEARWGWGLLGGLLLCGVAGPASADIPVPPGYQPEKLKLSEEELKKLAPVTGEALGSPSSGGALGAIAQIGVDAPAPAATGAEIAPIKLPTAGEGSLEAPPAAGLPPGGTQTAPGAPVEPALAAAPVVSAAPPGNLEVSSPKYGDGLTLNLSWTPSPDDLAAKEGGAPAGARNPVLGYVVLRSGAAEGPWEVISDVPAGASSFQDKVTSNPSLKPPLERYHYRVAVLTAATQAQTAAYAAAVAAQMTAGGGEGSPEAAATKQALEAYLAALTSSTPAVEGSPQFALFDLENLSLLLVILLFAGLIFYYTRQMRQGKNFYIRRIPGIDAIEEAIGRSTEMGKPILYVPGIDELQDIQTIASMLILGRVAEIVANYESDMIVPCTYPMVREVADEVVRAGYFSAGRPDAYDPKNVRFISSEQFAFCAGTNGIILRQQPAANLYLGRFFAEALIFAETGFVNRSIQIAGTAEPTQLPFFIVSCDYTIIGEELFAVSAYLSRDPRLVSSLRASDIIKALIIFSILVGTILSTLGYTGFSEFWRPGGG